MPITVTLPTDTKTPSTAGHTTDHNIIVDGITALGAVAFNLAGDTVSGLSEFDGGITFGTAAPGTPASGKAVIYSSSAGSIQAKNDSGISGSLSPSQSDVGTFTIVATGNNQFSKLWSIPANDASIGTVYRMTLWSGGTQGSTQQSLTVTPVLDAAVLIGGNRTSFPTTIITASTSFNCRAVFELLILTTGVSGTCIPSITVYLTQNTGTPADANSMTITAGPAASSTIDTTASHTLSFDAGWGATTGAPTITSKGTFFERLGT